ncbi:MULTISPECIES: sigma-54-dependent transcriptional regulator [Roseivirga]|uniref:AAA family ATPase n=1 Tax=Roseivirga spongicola TaxID=333140 RepID=A0A150X4C8_9BACT|nr:MULTISPECIES: sigma-54 dependent transcriptional regulator [Roseivirga]KYG73564.1 AAA family ATPase [Roseivirga spongicola]MBO6659833.1 sigma-54-dependent Fis family transcriptional regulator [Roseivirga sp.]MBO6907430.1 sigma-54-dependent Fis family transcriptional regulator [Roseivirga sp.]WPZ09806.1 sigma-54 dependent transcriptional regulator [Roseivirga spongicola]
MKTGRILIIDDNEDLLKAARIFLKRHFGQIDLEKDPTLIPDLLKNESYDVILLDMNFTQDVNSGQEGFHWLDKILEIDPSAVVVLITAFGSVDMAVRAIKAGATDFVMKPWENEKLLATMLSAIQLRSSKAEVQQLKDQQELMREELDHKFKDIIGQSSAMIRVFDTIERVAETDANVLVLGENGTGKELIARAIHRNSKRADKPFVTVDLGAITETLFESELFGHVRGAFTDAKTDRAGRFEVANGGTLFLDEIGNLSPALQAKLLTALQNKRISRVGSNKVLDVDIRLICATNMPLYEMVQKGEFRQDLLYRINTIELTLPSLKERNEDIRILAEHYLEQFAKKYNKDIYKFSEATVKRLEKYHWPGNVRELQHAVERAVIMSRDNILQPEDFFFNASNQPKDQSEINLEQYNLEDVERILIRKVLAKHNGNITHAAQELGLTRSSLYRRLEKYGL